MRFLYLHYADNVYGYVCSILRDEHDAEDVTQQIFSKLLTSLARYEPTAVPFSRGSCACRTTPRSITCACAGRSRSRRSAAPTSRSPTSARERWGDLRTALDTLPTTSARS
jgi:RNA polymerase sigma-70 factor (ECF subfamily)